jgi:acetyl-CoA carboxylase biotin carboxylase subunit
LSENAEFSQICADYGIKFIGATAAQINGMGDKATAKATMIKAGVPVVPGSEGLLESVEQGKELAEGIGYPVIVKATAGGGGRGMRIINKPEDFEKAWTDARTESAAAFGNDGLYLEKFVEEPRHIEIQIIGDQFGKVCHLSERDCSIQRRHQKLVEETPSPIITPEMREKMGAAAIKGAQSIGYEGAGTIEFLVDKHGDFYFMEMNTRIQVEHPITEEVTDFDLIKEQIKVAAGEPISGQNYTPKLYAMECRINAEDPANGFRPAPGKITNLHFPGGHGVRIDSHVYSGYTIPPNYDSMIAKLIVSGQSREEVLTRMKRALQEFVIEGIKTTIPFHIKLMDDPGFKSGNFTTKYLESFDFSTL